MRVRGGNPLAKGTGMGGVPVGFGLSKCSVFHAVSTMIGVTYNGGINETVNRGKSPAVFR